MDTTQKTYKFNELSEEVQQRLLEKAASNNINHEWWEFILEDAKTVGLEIEEFEIDRPSKIKIMVINDHYETATLILANYGEETSIHTLAHVFIQDWNALVEKHSDGIDKNRVAEDNEYQFDKEADELESEFVKTIGEEYLSILRKCYNELTSEKFIRECFEDEDLNYYEDGSEAEELI